TQNLVPFEVEQKILLKRFKYYLFDLTPDKSFVRWCLERGMDVYIISWINPDKNHHNKTFCDYTLEGLYKAVQAVLKTSKSDKINALGNCAGGILLNCLMAYLESHKIPSPFASATTLASPIDADRLGDLKAFICDVQIKMLEESLDDFGIVPAPVLSQSFNLLRPKDLVWSFYVKHYLMGKKPDAFDILFWNCDSVNLPGRMHSQYLRHIFLDNKLIKKGEMRLAGTPIDLRTITTPSFIVGAIKDHIVPWESVYPLAQMVNSTVKEFLLVGSGHVSGIINHPDKKKYQYWSQPQLHTSSKEWLKSTKQHEGSWWLYWFEWVKPYLGEMITPKKTDSMIENAPGRYVLKKHDDKRILSKKALA
ncbi:MAG: alpha/beta fold hydrolase, partial [Alphaproteobacteria bacterium]|nr:alpha/beta fold hydrolase [Alphaproteobacteria bacterium]